MDYHTPMASSNPSRPDQFGAYTGNPVNNRRAHAGPFADPAALLGRHLDCLANTANFTGTNGSHPPNHSVDETLDILDGLNCEVNSGTLSTTVEPNQLTPWNPCQIGLNTSRNISLQEEVMHLASTYKCDPQHLSLELLSPDLLAAGLHRLAWPATLPPVDTVNEEAAHTPSTLQPFPSLFTPFGQDLFHGAFLPTPTWTPHLNEAIFDRPITATECPPLFDFSDQPRPGPTEAGPSKAPVTALPSPALTERSLATDNGLADSPVPPPSSPVSHAPECGPQSPPFPSISRPLTEDGDYYEDNEVEDVGPVTAKASKKNPKKAALRPYDRPQPKKNKASVIPVVPVPCTYTSPYDGYRCPQIVSRPYDVPRHREVHVREEYDLVLKGMLAFADATLLSTDTSPQYLCPVCKASFSRSDALQRHLKDRAKERRATHEQKGRSNIPVRKRGLMAPLKPHPATVDGGFLARHRAALERMQEVAGEEWDIDEMMREIEETAAQA